MPSNRPQIVMHFTPGRICLLLLVCALLLPGCASRYRMELFLLKKDQRTKVKVEKSEYLLGTVLGDPQSLEKVTPGDGNCLAIVTGSRGRSVDAKAQDLVSFDRYDRYRIFLQLSSAPAPDTVLLNGHSFVQQLGRYEVEVEDKIYYPIEGRLIVDSLSGRHLFCGISGLFENRLKESISFHGQFKVKVAD